MSLRCEPNKHGGEIRARDSIEICATRRDERESSSGHFFFVLRDALCDSALRYSLMIREGRISHNEIVFRCVE